MGFAKDLVEAAAGAGVAPSILRSGGKNAGFGLGILPGLIYRNQYDEDQPAATAQQQQAAGMKKGGKVSSASARGDGCCERGKTKGRMV